MHLSKLIEFFFSDFIKLYNKITMKQEVARKSWFDGEQFVSGWAGGQLKNIT